MSKSWKAAENRVGIWYGAKGIKKSGRQPLSGGNSGVTRGDAPHDSIFIETKRDKKYHSVIRLWRSLRSKNSVCIVSLPVVEDNKIVLRSSDLWCFHSNDFNKIVLMLKNGENINVNEWSGPYPSALTLYEYAVSIKNSSKLDRDKKVVTCNLIYHGHQGFWVIINKNDIIKCWDLILESRIKREKLIKEEESWDAVVAEEENQQNL